MGSAARAAAVRAALAMEKDRLEADMENRRTDVACLESRIERRRRTAETDQQSTLMAGAQDFAAERHRCVSSSSSRREMTNKASDAEVSTMNRPGAGRSPSSSDGETTGGPSTGVSS